MRNIRNNFRLTSMRRIISDKKNNPLNKIDDFARIAKYSVQLGTATGFITIFSYCFFEINWMPISISISDSINLLMIALGVGIYALIIITFLFTFLFYVPLLLKLPIYAYREAKKNLHKNKIDKIDKLIIFLAISSLLYIIYTYNEYKLIVNFFILGIIYFHIPEIIKFIISLIKEIKREHIIIFFFIITILFIIILHKNRIITRLGISTSNVTIQLSDSDYKFALNEARLRDQNLNSLNNNIIYHVNILWHGIGSYTLVEFPLCEENKTFRMAVKTDEIKIITPTYPKPTDCSADRSAEHPQPKHQPHVRTLETANSILPPQHNNR